ncbi:MAG: flagellar protein [Clostridia bacterium]|nr:flagellar protein [Clostridia bacterium]
MHDKTYIKPNIITTGKTFIHKTYKDKSKSADTSFKDILKQLSSSNKEGIKFSKHSIERMNMRQIKLTRSDIDKIENAVNKAKNKGVSDSLIIMQDKAFIVSVKNHTVITVIDKDNLKENIITNIDGAVIV